MNWKLFKILLIFHAFFLLPGSPCFASAMEFTGYDDALLFHLSDKGSRLPLIEWLGRDHVVIDRRIVAKVSPSSLQVLKNMSSYSIFSDPSGENALVFNHHTGQLFVGNLLGGEMYAVQGKYGNIGKVLWSSKGKNCLFLSGKKLFSMKTTRTSGGRTVALMENCSDFFLSSDGHLVIALSAGTATLMRSDGFFKSRLPQNGVYVDGRGNETVAGNFSPDFRKFIIDENKGGFTIGFVGMGNSLTLRKGILPQVSGVRDAAFSPDGNWVALTALEKDGVSYMIVISAAGELLRKSSLNKNWVVKAPKWTSGGTHIIWPYFDTVQKANRYIVSDRKGISVRTISQNVNVGELYVSPEAPVFIFKAADTLSYTGHYRVYNIKNSQISQIMAEKPYNTTGKPVWSPDGTRAMVSDFSVFRKREVINGLEVSVFKQMIFLYSSKDGKYTFWR